MIYLILLLNIFTLISCAKERDIYKPEPATKCKPVAARVYYSFLEGCLEANIYRCPMSKGDFCLLAIAESDKGIYEMNCKADIWPTDKECLTF